METDLLAKAREYEAKYGSLITAEERPVYHVTPTVGWLNDPNGLSYYDGKYHLFYQYNPYATAWDTMHWGHLVSEDLLHWKRLPAAMAPAEPYENYGVWSGSAITAPDGRHLLIYTAVEDSLNEDGSRKFLQTQCLAFGDGVNYVKYEKNPVITPDMLPEGSSSMDFRDPKIWYEEEEACYYTIIGSSTEQYGGAVVLFRSPDLFNWEYVSTLDKSDNVYGFMWECPDLFRLGDTDFITFLPMKMFAKGLEFHSGNNAAYVAGSYDRKNHTFTRKRIFSLDYGIDFYAPQTMVTPDGRRIMSAWMQTPETKEAVMPGAKWFGQLIFPRELSERNGKAERIRSSMKTCALWTGPACPAWRVEVWISQYGSGLPAEKCIENSSSGSRRMKSFILPSCMSLRRACSVLTDLIRDLCTISFPRERRMCVTETVRLSFGY